MNQAAAHAGAATAHVAAAAPIAAAAAAHAAVNAALVFPTDFLPRPALRCLPLSLFLSVLFCATSSVPV